MVDGNNSFVNLVQGDLCHVNVTQTNSLNMGKGPIKSLNIEKVSQFLAKGIQTKVDHSVIM